MDDPCRRYARLLAATAAHALAMPAPVRLTRRPRQGDLAQPAVPMEAADVLARAVAERITPGMATPETPLTLDDAFRLAYSSNLVVEDGGGHRRSFYPALLLYARAMAACLSGSPIAAEADALRRWTAALPAESLPATEPGRGLPARLGEQACRVIWRELAQRTAAGALGGAAGDGKAMAALVRAQRPSGSFLTPIDTDNPEPMWYHDLILLHALASYAADTRNKPACDAVRRAAWYHLNETQPDHASSQPWAVHAFAAEVGTIPMADSLLLTAGVQQPGAVGAIARLLMSDAAWRLWQLVGEA